MGKGNDKTEKSQSKLSISERIINKTEGKTPKKIAHSVIIPG